MKKLILILVLVLTACTIPPSMSTIVSNCDVAENQEFSKFKNCIQTTYSQTSSKADSFEYKAFSAKLDEINENYSSQKITSIQAKSITYQEYENRFKKVAPPTAIQPNPVIQPRRPINCQNYGTYTSCY